MKNLFILAVLVSAMTACQPSTPPMQTAAVSPTVLVAAAKPVIATSVVSAPPALPDSLTQAMLTRHDLSKLLQTTHSFREGDPVQPMNGFFGPDRYRIEVVLTSVHLDPRQPGRYLVQGLDRYKKRILPFVGTITFTKVQVEPLLPGIPSDGWSYYTALGTYELREDASRPGAGTFQGRIATDIGIKLGKGLFNYAQTEHTPSQGGSILYNGTWTSTTGQTKPAVWVADILNYAGPQVFNDFVVGERDRDINPKYARLGWNSYWENEEWWSNTPHSVAQMQRQRPTLFTPPVASRDEEVPPVAVDSATAN